MVHNRGSIGRTGSDKVPRGWSRSRDPALAYSSSASIGCGSSVVDLLAKASNSLKERGIKVFRDIAPLPDHLNLARKDGAEGRSPSVYVHNDNVEFSHEIEDVALVDNFSDLIKPTKAYVDFVEYVTVPRDEQKEWREVTEFNTTADLDGFYSIHCNSNGKFVYRPKIVNVGRFSPWRGHRSAQSSVSRIANRLFELERNKVFNQGQKVDYLLKITLTFPESFLATWLENPVEGSRIARAATKLLFRKLERKYCRYKDEKLGASYNVHPWSTKFPSKKPHPHVHLSLLNTAVRKVSDGEYVFKRFQPWIDHLELKLLWKECLEYFQLDLPPGLLPVVHISACKLQNHGQVTHWLKYCSRKPTADIANYYQEHAFTSYDIAARKFLDFLLTYENRRINLGFLCRLKDIVGECKAEKVCPVCAGEARVGIFVDLPEFKQKIDAGLKFFMYDKTSKKFSSRSADFVHTWLDNLAG